MFVISLLKHMFPVSGPKPIARTFIRFVVTGKTAPEPVQNFNPCKDICLPLLIYKLYPCTGPPGPPTCTRFTRWVQPARTDGTWLNLGGYKHRQPFIRPEVNPRALIMVERPGNQTTQRAARSLALTTQPYNVIINAIYTFPCPVGSRPMAWTPTKVGAIPRLPCREHRFRGETLPT